MSLRRWCEGVDAELEGFEAGPEVFDAVELVSPRALGAFDMAVELGPLRRQDEEAQVALSAWVLELGPQLRPAIDLDALEAEGGRSIPRFRSIGLTGLNASALTVSHNSLAMIRPPWPNSPCTQLLPDNGRPPWSG